jgi:hypothetical protein
MTIRTATQQILDHLHATPGGATRVEMAAALPISVRHVQNMTSRLSAAGTIAWVKEGGAGKDNYTRRYFALQHAPVIAVALPPAPKLAKPVKHANPLELGRAKAAVPAKHFVQAPATNPRGVKVTVCPHGVDKRFSFEPPPGWVGQITQDWGAR